MRRVDSASTLPVRLVDRPMGAEKTSATTKYHLVSGHAKTTQRGRSPRGSVATSHDTPSVRLARRPRRSTSNALSRGPSTARPGFAGCARRASAVLMQESAGEGQASTSTRRRARLAGRAPEEQQHSPRLCWVAADAANDCPLRRLAPWPTQRDLADTLRSEPIRTPLRCPRGDNRAVDVQRKTAAQAPRPSIRHPQGGLRHLGGE